MSVVVEESAKGKGETKKAVKKLKDELKDGTAVRKELDKIWEQIKRDAYDMCPKDTGALAGTIRIIKIPTGAMLGGISRIKGLSVFDRSIIAGDITKINPKSGKPVDYAVFVHDGHKMRDGRMYEGVPFLSEALALNEGELMKAIQRALKKLGRKYESD